MGNKTISRRRLLKGFAGIDIGAASSLRGARVFAQARSLIDAQDKSLRNPGSELASVGFVLPITWIYRPEWC